MTATCPGSACSGHIKGAEVHIQLSLAASGQRVAVRVDLQSRREWLVTGCNCEPKIKQTWRQRLG